LFPLALGDRARPELADLVINEGVLEAGLIAFCAALAVTARVAHPFRSQIFRSRLSQRAAHAGSRLDAHALVPLQLAWPPVRPRVTALAAPFAAHWHRHHFPRFTLGSH
jgi:hypothetical protein